MFGQLTNNGGTFGLPVHSEHNRPRGVVDSEGIKHPRTIWRIWTDAELVAKGLVRIDENSTPAGKRRNGQKTDDLVNNRISRVHEFIDKPPPPAPVPENHASDRMQELRTTVENLEYRQIDTLCRFIVNLKSEHANVLAATGLAPLITVLGRITDVPRPVDAFAAKWQAARQKFPRS